MELLTDPIRDKFGGEYRIGVEGGCFYALYGHLPPMPVARDAAILMNLSNEQIIKHRAKVPCRELQASYDTLSFRTCYKCAFVQPESDIMIGFRRYSYYFVFRCQKCGTQNEFPS